MHNQNNAILHVHVSRQGIYNTFYACGADHLTFADFILVDEIEEEEENVPQHPDVVLEVRKDRNDSAGDVVGDEESDDLGGGDF